MIFRIARRLQAAVFFLVCCLGAVHAQDLVTQRGVSVTTSDLKATFAPNSEGARLTKSFASDSQATEVLDTLLVIKLNERHGKATLRPTSEETAHLAFAANRWNLELTLDTIAERVKANFKADDPLVQTRAKELYDSLPNGFKTPARASVAHILLRLKDRTLVDAAKLADELTQRARAGISFEQLVKDFSDDQSSISKGGLIGEFFDNPGSDHPMVQAAFRTKEDKSIADPVVSRSGLHVVKILSRQAERRATFDEAKAQLLEQILGERIRFARETYLKELRGAEPPKMNESNVNQLIERNDPATQEKIREIYKTMQTNEKAQKPQTK